VAAPAAAPATAPHTTVLTGVPIHSARLAADHWPQPLPYHLILWVVSLLALVQNLLKAAVRKATTPRHLTWAQILWQMGRDPRHISSPFVDRGSRYNHQAKVGAAGGAALDLFYHYPDTVAPALQANWEGRLTRFWIARMHNRQAVAARLHLATALLTDALLRYRQEPVVRVISIATGSTVAILHAIRQSGVRNVEVTVLDSDAAALDAVRVQVIDAGLADCVRFVQGTTRRLDALCVGRPPHIIEMIGFLDYRTDAKAIELIRTIYANLAPGGLFLTGNIHPNRERIFLDWVLLWPMIYRTADQLVNLLISGDFGAKGMELHYEPFGIHGIAVCQKAATRSLYTCAA
jgi:hypothetical protein